MAEFELIDRIARRAAVGRGDVVVGIGDDAAVLAVPAGHQLVVTTDTLVDGIHFPVGTDPASIGWKALAVNLSDLAAMGASPAWASLALTLPAQDVQTVDAFVEVFLDGFAALAAQHRVALVGGDLTRGPLSITVTVHGFVPDGQALLRDGARVGDSVFITGTLGDAAAGLRLLSQGATFDGDDLQSTQRQLLLERLDRPTPRIAAGLILRGVASACIDVSDGLLADLGHIARRSGVGIDIDAANLPASSALFDQICGEARTALQLAGGDDYELAFTVPPPHVEAITRDLAKLGCGVTRIGRVVEGGGVRALAADGSLIETDRIGWNHFS